MTNYSKHVSQKATAQTQPIFGKNMQQNNAGGYGFGISAEQQFERFLILGNEGGTYYVGEATLTKENAKNAIAYIQANGEAAVRSIVEISESGRAPKNDPAIFALALAATYGDAVTKSAAYAAISRVCRTGTHLFAFVQSIQDLRGWSRGLRKGVSKFYTGRSLQSLDNQLIKYRQRNGWTHKDVLRLAHTSSQDAAVNARLSYAVGKGLLVRPEVSALLEAFETLQATRDENAAASIILKNRLTWEAVPTELLNSKVVWEALLENMPYTAMLRNLGKMTAIGLIDTNFSKAAQTVATKLVDAQAIKASRVHPFAIFLALKTYSAGAGFRGKLTWTPSSKVVAALNDAFELSFGNVKATGKNILIGVDVSGSMTATINNTNISASEAAAVMALITLRTEPNAEVVNFDTTVGAADLNRRDSLSSTLKKYHGRYGGGTDCAQPLVYANHHKLNIDAVVIFTDNETWAGNRHAVQELASLRKRLNKGVKIINAATTATSHSISDPSDPNALGIAGFDASAPALISTFISGDNNANSETEGE